MTTYEPKQHVVKIPGKTRMGTSGLLIDVYPFLKAKRAHKREVGKCAEC
jgi:hypothetical protein